MCEVAWSDGSDLLANEVALCEVSLSDGSDLVAKKLEFGLEWNSPSHTNMSYALSR